MTSQPRAVSDLIARVSRTITERALLKGGERVVLAVSGGPDSTVLLHTMAALAPRLNLELHVATFDHRLRATSAGDVAFVQRQADALGLPCIVGVADETTKIKGKSPEESARIRRLKFLEQTAASLTAGRIATGHTLDDQAETVLMRLLQGTGRRGLSGINAKRWWFIRPLIDLRRRDIEAFCKAARLRPRIDESNNDPAFLRNVIRHETIPFLEQTMHAGLREALARLSDVIRDEDAYLDERAAMLGPWEWADADHREVKMAVADFASLPAALQRRQIRLLTWTVANVVHDARHTERIRTLALHAGTGDSIDLPEGLRARVEYGFILLGRAPSPIAALVPVSLDVPGETDLPGWAMRVRSWVSTDHPVSWPDGRRLCVLDADRVPTPLRVRRAKPGDRFRPLGMARQKKVGDFFTDAKVPRGTRSRIPLVVDNDDEVVWIPGHRIDDRAKVNAQSSRFLWLSAEGGIT
jgi:tRNA(Ile)-lysidine synthase